ncbi:MAG: hypothetical protein Ct9H300mP8_05580 [Gammaproteobacteria bacterium]|nr:MAG: hypothetical protein Ct9H300mP8_05580 [Gammaproteobacteria bacterium]
MNSLTLWKTLAQIAGVEVPHEAGVTEARRHRFIRDSVVGGSILPIGASRPKLSEKAVGYLQSRGITGVTARDFWHRLCGLLVGMV